MILRKVVMETENRHGVAVLDPHGDLVERLLCLLSEQDIERTIYFNPGDPDYVPLWNPIKRIPGQDIGRTADDLVTAIRSFVGKDSWGDRLEHLFRNIIFSVMHLPEASFLDISNLLRNTTKESMRFRDEILHLIQNEAVRQFWRHDFGLYRKDDMGPPKNKLSKLLVSERIELMFSQPESRFDFRSIMDKGMILLINLSTVGPTAKEALGCFFLSLLHLTALGRSDTLPEQRRPFHIYCDEAHRFMTDALEDLIAETRKFGVSLTLAHHYISQFGNRKADALSSVGSTIIFNVDTKDAGRLKKDLQGLVEIEDVISLKRQEAIARIGTDVVRIKTLKRRELPETHFRDRVIQESRRRYYKPAHEVREAILRHSEPWRTPSSFLNRIRTGEAAENPHEELIYDKLS